MHFADPFPPPSEVHISNVGPRGITLSWNDLFNCPALVYLVSSTGDHESCPNNPVITNTSSITLPNIIPNGAQCNFTVQTQVCGMINGSKQVPVSVTFKGNFMSN